MSKTVLTTVALMFGAAIAPAYCTPAVSYWEKDPSAWKVAIYLMYLWAPVLVGGTLLKGFSLEGGVRRSALKTSATSSDRPEVNRTPGIWDPLVGVMLPYLAGKKWALRAHMDGGGVGVGTDVSLGAAFRADWSFAKHFG